MSHRVLARGLGDRALHPADIDRLEVSPLRDLQNRSSLVWIDVESDDQVALHELGEILGFDPEAIEDVLDIEQLPKFVDYGDHVFVVLHALTAEGDRVDTTELDVFVAPGLLVTVHSRTVVGVDWLWDAVQSHPHLTESGSDEVFGHLAEVVGRRYFEIVYAIEARIDELAEPALAADPHVLAAVQILRREEATVRQMLRPQRLALGELRSRNRSVIGAGAVSLFDDAFDVHNQVVESLAVARGLLTDTLDTYRGASAERQANATTVLAVYSAILLPLTLIVGFYGMNVDSLPVAEHSLGWLVVLGVMLALAVLSTLMFIRTGLIRLPWARSRQLVRGVASAARAPVRPLAMLWRPDSASED